MFEKYREELSKQPERKMIEVKLFDNPAYNPLALKQKLMNVDSLGDTELYKLIHDGYETMLHDIFNDSTSVYLNAIVNVRILTALIHVMSTVREVSHINRVYCNKLAYDYLTLSSNTNETIKQLLFTLSKNVNKDVIPKLLGLGIAENLAAYMALARFSSQKELVNVKRLNFVIMTSPLELMSEQMIVYIYEKLFDRITILFIGTMVDSSREDLTEEMDEIYSIISLAILDMLENMSLIDIRKVLISYAGDYPAYNNGKPRFSLDCLSNDYARINSVHEALKLENVYVP